MRKKTRWWLMLFSVLMTAVLLSGCSTISEFTLTPQSLYSLPQLPPQYMALRQQLNTILDEGAEYAAPASGTNIQPVQMADLDGDGQEEALAFFRKTEDARPLKIYIFSVVDGGYEQTALIEGSGSTIYSIAYHDLDGNGRTELAVGWRVSTELQALTVYDLRSDGPTELLRTDYVKYTVADLNQDGLREVAVFRSGDEGAGVIDYYDWTGGNLGQTTSMRISATMAELNRQGRVSTGMLAEGVPALFVTGVTENARAVTDILTMRQGALHNIVLSVATGVSAEITSFQNLYPVDMNADGITEVPHPEPLFDHVDGTAAYYRIRWLSYNSEGEAVTAMTTFHNYGDGWYLQMPETWEDRVLADRVVSAEENHVTFYIRSEGGVQTRAFLRITDITGTNREQLAVRGERFILSRQTSHIYTAELLDGNDDWEYGVTESDVRAAFRLIATEWTVGDN